MSWDNSSGKLQTCHGFILYPASETNGTEVTVLCRYCLITTTFNPLYHLGILSWISHRCSSWGLGLWRSNRRRVESWDPCRRWLERRRWRRGWRWRCQGQRWWWMPYVSSSLYFPVSNSSTNCSNSCHSEGHFARDCPDKPANVCFNCKKEGYAPSRPMLAIASNGMPVTPKPSVPKSVLMTVLVVSVRRQAMLPAIVLKSHLQSAIIASKKVGDILPPRDKVYPRYW